MSCISSSSRRVASLGFDRSSSIIQFRTRSFDPTACYTSSYPHLLESFRATTENAHLDDGKNSLNITLHIPQGLQAFESSMYCVYSNGFAARNKPAVVFTGLLVRRDRCIAPVLAVAVLVSDRVGDGGERSENEDC